MRARTAGALKLGSGAPAARLPTLASADDKLQEALMISAFFTVPLCLSSIVCLLYALSVLFVDCLFAVFLGNYLYVGFIEHLPNWQESMFRDVVW